MDEIGADSRAASLGGAQVNVDPRRLRGRHLKLSPQRRWMGDMAAACLQTPATIGGELAMRLSPALVARRALADPPSWTAIILKAYAVVAMRRAELRRIYLTFPTHRLYEHPCSVANVVIEREWNGEMGVFFHQILAPETLPLSQIDAIIRGLRDNPIETSRDFSRLIKLSRLPRFVRRFAWWYGLRVSGHLHARYFGTFSINALLRSRRWSLMQSMTPITMSLSHQALEPPAQIRVYGVFDHRVFDGMPMSRALADLEATINNEITAELRSMGGTTGQARPAQASE